MEETLPKILAAVKVLLEELGFTEVVKDLAYELLQKYPQSDAIRRLAFGNIEHPHDVMFTFWTSEEVQK